MKSIFFLLLTAGLKVFVFSYEAALFTLFTNTFEKTVPGPAITTILALIGSSISAKMLQILIVYAIFVTLHVNCKSCY